MAYGEKASKRNENENNGGIEKQNSEKAKKSVEDESQRSMKEMKTNGEIMKEMKMAWRKCRRSMAAAKWRKASMAKATHRENEINENK
jgi:hypothetical protein